MGRVVLVLVVLTATARADSSKLAKDGVPIEARGSVRGKDKRCCGYPLVATAGWALRFYWDAMQSDYDEPEEVGGESLVSTNLYDMYGGYLGTYSERFAWHARMEGTAITNDGRILNTTGQCWFGYGTCFEQLDVAEHPFGRGNKGRPLIPFKSVAIDPRLVPIGEPLYIPEFDGLVLPDGSIHDGCVRADDTGGGIKKRKMDFFVVTYGNFRFLLDELANVTCITPHIQSPRCAYLRDL